MNKFTEIAGKILISAMAKTWRFKITGKLPEAPAIVVFWHGKMMPGWYLFRKKNPYAVVSLSRDGQILSDLLEYWGFKLIRGSSSRGGKEVLAKLTETAKYNLICITPDGPQGPPREFKAGAVIASHRSGAPLYLCSIDIRSKKVFDKAWDKFELPLPFSKIIINISGPVSIPGDSSREDINSIIKTVEKQLQ